MWEKLDWSDPQKNPEINSPSVVSGPYKLKEWKRDQYAIFVANDKYWYHGAPNITKQTIEIVPNQDIAYQKLKSGESDTASITPDNLAEARTLPNINVYEWWPAAAVWSYIGLNNRDGFRHPRRQRAPRHRLRHRQATAHRPGNAGPGQAAVLDLPRNVLGLQPRRAVLQV